MSCLDDTNNSMSQAYRPQPAKTVYFYRDGDPQKGCLRMALNPSRYRSMDTLFSELTGKMPELSYGVRAVFTPKGRTRVQSLDDFDQDGHYICSTNERRSRTHGLDLAIHHGGNMRMGKQAPLPAIKPSLFTTRQTGVRQSHQQPRSYPTSEGEGSNPASLTSRKNDCKRINVHKNGDPSRRHVILLNRKNARSFDHILEDMSEIFRMSVRRLYTLEGDSIESLSAIFNGPESYVVAGLEKYKPLQADTSNTPKNHRKMNGVVTNGVVKERKATKGGQNKSNTSHEESQWTVWVTTHSGDDTAGTTANVFLTVYGKTGSSGPLALLPKEDEIVDAFKAGVMNEFQITLGHIGDISKIRIFHDNSGQSPSWLVGEVRLLELSTGEELVFKCDRWLSREKGDREICRELPAIRVGKKPLPVTKYSLVVTTGDCWNAGTLGEVFVTLYGDLGDSGQRQLLNPDEDGTPHFHKGNISSFELEGVSLGTLKKLVVTLVGVGPGYGWFLEKIAVSDMFIKTTKEVVFSCNKWLDEGEGDGKLTRELVAETPASLDILRKQMWQCEKWKFQPGVQLVLFSKATEKAVSIRAAGKVDAFGEIGDVESYLIVIESKASGGNIRSFRSCLNNNQMLSMDRSGLNGRGKGGLDSQFMIRVQPDRSITMETMKHPRQLVKVNTGSSTADPDEAYFIVHCKGAFRDEGIVMFGTSITQTLFVEQDNKLYATGRRNEASHFRVHKMEKGSIRMFESLTFADQFLRIKDGVADCLGTGDISCQFRVVRFRETGYISLESVRHPGTFLGITLDGHVQPMTESASKNLQFYPEVIKFGVEHSEQMGDSSSCYDDENFTDDVTTDELNGVADDDDEIGTISWKIFTLSGNTCRNADVVLFIYGEESSSGPVPLGCASDEHGIFMAGNMDEFKVKLPDLGPIYKIRIELHPVHPTLEPFWILQEIILENMVTGEREVFDFSNWPFGRDSEDHEICREMSIVTGNEEPLPLVYYEVTVETGDVPGADTRSNIYICLVGEKGDTGLRQLYSSDDDEHFQQAQVDHFRIHSVHLGRLKQCLVQHDGYQPNEGWFCESIIVQDPLSQKEAIFNCQSWLDACKGDKKISRLLPAEGYVESAARLQRIVHAEENDLIEEEENGTSSFTQPSDANQSQEENPDNQPQKEEIPTEEEILARKLFDDVTSSAIKQVEENYNGVAGNQENDLEVNTSPTHQKKNAGENDGEALKENNIQSSKPIENGGVH